MDRQNVKFFVGKEVEYTKFYGKQTLFVVGNQPISLIREMAIKHNCGYIYLGANCSWAEWSTVDLLRTLEVLLAKEYFVTIDLPLSAAQTIRFPQHSNLVIIASVIVSGAEEFAFGPSTYLKIDDRAMDLTNDGVWVIPLSKILSEAKFTPWSDYVSDTAVDICEVPEGGDSLLSRSSTKVGTSRR